MSVNNYSETAKWFFELSRNAKKVAKAYKKANRQAQKASKQVKVSIEASRAANVFAEQILGGHVVSNGNNIRQEIPVVVTDQAEHKRLWNEWFASVQAELDNEKNADADN